MWLQFEDFNVAFHGVHGGYSTLTLIKYSDMYFWSQEFIACRSLALLSKWVWLNIMSFVAFLNFIIRGHSALMDEIWLSCKRERERDSEDSETYYCISWLLVCPILKWLVRTQQWRVLVSAKSLSPRHLESLSCSYCVAVTCDFSWRWRWCWQTTLASLTTRESDARNLV